MSCNGEMGDRRRDTRHVSIPIGFSNELQLPLHQSLLKQIYVSIPIGFSNELQRKGGLQRRGQD